MDLGFFFLVASWAFFFGFYRYIPRRSIHHDPPTFLYCASQRDFMVNGNLHLHLHLYLLVASLLLHVSDLTNVKSSSTLKYTKGPPRLHALYLYLYLFTLTLPTL